MLQITEGLIVLLAVVAALQYYGHVTVSALSPDRKYDAGITLAVGISLYNVLAGVLEVSCTANSLFLVGLVLSGAVLGTARLAWRLKYLPLSLKPGPGTPIFLIFIFLLAAFLINAAYWNYSALDDRMGYLVFPERILEQGCIGRDMFHFRRIEAGLGGGGSYNYALFQAFLNITHARLADLGLGSICLLLLVHGHARELKLSPPVHAAALLLGLCIVVFSPIINNTPETLGKAVLYALLRLTMSSYLDRCRARRGALIALLFCCLAILKTSFVPPATAVVLAFYGTLILTRFSPGLIKEGASSALLVFIFLSPWMLVSYDMAGTLWYPILGTGTFGDAEVAGFAKMEQYLKDGGRLAFIMAFPCFMAFVGIRRRCWGKLSLFAAVIPLLMTVLVLASQTKFTIFGYRYGHMGPATLFLFYTLISAALALQARWTRAVQAIFQTLIIALLVSNNTLGYRWFYDGWIGHQLQGRATPSSTIALMNGTAPAYQLAIPDGQSMLAFVPWPSLLDFGRNNVFVMDWPGMTGPPGMPDLDNIKAWKEYLISIGARYVVYSYGNEVGYSDAQIARDIDAFRYSQFQVHLLSNFRAAKATFLAMKSCGPVVYDDGIVAVFEPRLLSDICLATPPNTM